MNKLNAIDSMIVTLMKKKISSNHPKALDMAKAMICEDCGGYSSCKKACQYAKISSYNIALDLFIVESMMN